MHCEECRIFIAPEDLFIVIDEQEHKSVEIEVCQECYNNLMK